jgi:dihydrodiol dehydrogenase / D-xylose 1-dehydrogenase (NADP)
MNFGVIGLGKISTKFVLEFQHIEGSTIIMAGSRDLEKAKDYCSEHNIEETGTYHEVIHHPNIEAIYIGTPHHLHYEIAKKALTAGKHVLCEKPITTDAKQYKELISIASEKKLMLMDAMWTYFLPAMVKAKAWANEDKIGKIKYINIDFAFPAVQDLEGRLYNPELAGGALLDIGVYLLYTSFLFAGHEFKSMHCTAELSTTKVDESLSILLDYGNIKSNLYCSIKHKAINSAFIYGENGSIEVPLFWRTSSANLVDHEGLIVEKFIDSRLSHGFEFEINHFIDCVEKKKLESPILTHALTLKVMETMDEIRRRVGVRYPFE